MFPKEGARCCGGAIKECPNTYGGLVPKDGGVRKPGGVRKGLGSGCEYGDRYGEFLNEGVGVRGGVDFDVTGVGIARLWGTR